jgi:type I restriction enzyme R subunit
MRARVAVRVHRRPEALTGQQYSTAGLGDPHHGLGASRRRTTSLSWLASGRGRRGIPQEQPVALPQEKYEIVTALFHEFDYTAFFGGSAAQRLRVLAGAEDHILALKDGKQRLLKVVGDLSRAFVLAVPHEEALAIRDEVGFFQAVRAALIKHTVAEAEAQDALDSAINQLVSKAVTSTEVVDIFAAAGLQKPEISILSDEFLAEVRELPQRNLALELLKKLLNDEIRARGQRNVVQGRSFAAMLERTIRAYQNRSIEVAEVIAELIELAKEMRAAQQRGEQLGLSDDELAFYDALGVNDSAVQAMGDETLRTIARELVATVRRNVTIDWAVKESVRAKLRTIVKRRLRTYGYPPDRQEKAVQTILEQTEVLCKDWAG